MNVRKLLLALFTIATMIRHTSAQPLELTLDDAIKIGLDKSKSIHSSMMKVQYADAKASEASATLLPSLKFSGSYSRLSDVPPSQITIPANFFGPGFPPSTVSSVLSPVVLNNYSMRLSVQQPLFTGFKVQRNADIAGYGAQAAQKEFDRDRSDLIINIKNAYWNLYKAIKLEKVVDESVEQIKAHLKDIQNWQAQGIATTNDVLKVQVQLSDAQLRQIDMNNNVQLATISLNSLIGLPLDTGVQLKTDARHDPKQFSDLNALVQKAFDRRPDLKSMELRVQASDAAVTLAQSGWWPQLYLVGSYLTARPNQRFFPTQDEFKDTWDVGVSLSFDIWNWGTTVHQTDQAKAQLAQAQDGLSQIRDGIVLDVTRSYLNLRRSKERISVAEGGVKQAEENYRVTKDKFKQGLATNSDLLDAEVALLQAKTNYTQAFVDYELDESALERAVGE